MFFTFLRKLEVRDDQPEVIAYSLQLWRQGRILLFSNWHVHVVMRAASGGREWGFVKGLQTRSASQGIKTSIIANIASFAG